MSQDLTYIRNSLKGYTEVNSVYDISKNDKIKYITINENDNEEYFHDGGIYLGMGDNFILIRENNGRPKNIPLNIVDKDGSILYNTRIFISSNEEETKNSYLEYEKIIQNQQNIIEKLSIQNKKYKDIIDKLHDKNINYESTLKRLINKN